MWAEFDAFCRERGAPGLPDGPEGPRFIHESPYLNLYLYPAEVDYPRAVPLGPTWHRLDSCVRTTESTWELPERLAHRAGALIYLSLGSLGSADVGLMQPAGGRARPDAPPVHRVQGSASRRDTSSHDNMVGEGFLPQPAILPMVDLVITHGGNNTVTECFHNGKPMIVLPLFWDQFDNAQRVDETGFGVRLPTYDFEAAEMTAAIDRLLGDDALHARLAAASARLRANPGTVRAADLIERLAATGEPVTAG